MAVTLTGTPNFVTANTGGSQSGSTAVTIPSDCEAVVFISHGSWNSAGDCLVSKLNWDNHATNQDFTSIVSNYDGANQYGAAALIMTDSSVDWPGTGSKTLYWGYSRATTEGGVFTILFLKGLDSGSPIRASDSDSKATTFTHTLTGSVSGDLTISNVSDWHGNSGTIDANTDGSATNIDSSFRDNDVRWDLDRIDGATSVSVTAGSDGVYTVSLAFTIKQAAAFPEIVINQNLSVIENITVELPVVDLSLSIFENVGAEENITISMPLAGISAFDGIGANENIGPDVPLAAITGVENIGVEEFLSLLQHIVPSVFENIGIIEFINVLKQSADIEISIDDSIGLEESIQAIIDDLLISNQENIGVAEFIAAAMQIILSQQENIGVAEAITVLMRVLLSAADQVALTEDIQVALTGILAGISEQDILALIENINVVLEQVIGAISVSENIGIIENVLAQLEGGGFQVTDSLGVLESIVARLPLALTISDLIAISEFTQVNLQAGINLIDAINIEESIQAQFDVLLTQRVENIGVSEFISVLTSGVVGLVTASMTFSRPGAGFIFSASGGSFNLN